MCVFIRCLRQLLCQIRHIGDENVEDTLEHDDETLGLQQLVVESDELDIILSFSGLTAVIIAYV